MTRLASRFGAANLIRRDRPLTREELFRVVPSVFSEDKHESRSERYTYIPTISLLDSLQREGFQPFFACQTRVRDPGRREHTKHMLRLRREGQITGKQVPEIILLNSHDGSSSYQMLPGLFRAVCQNGLVCGDTAFSDETVIKEHIDAGITLADAVNFLVDKYELVRIDRRGFSWQEQSPYLRAVDILRARRAIGLLRRSINDAVL
ncbi:TA system toxin CbtA family protein [Escherichia coli]|nr:DUF932 domain-containing protein [Escherichia coli]QKY39177.1 DUF932 domain-containing protein [Escherichia coli]HAL6009492.1 DUF932 domain-containing protein [Escherichia coli]HBK3103848.1 DUF932 domain-containing protein [Escherichia coli]HCO1353526.1 DUF932 domain-containing protein [Escherichia coli]